MFWTILLGLKNCAPAVTSRAMRVAFVGGELGLGAIMPRNPWRGDEGLRLVSAELAAWRSFVGSGIVPLQGLQTILDLRRVYERVDRRADEAWATVSALIPSVLCGSSSP